MRLSIVIPTCDRPDKLRECLRRVMPQMGPDYEVIVSDDGRGGGLPEAPPGVCWVQGPRRGPAANRNFGARRASGEWLVFLDDDCLPQETWLSAFDAAAGPDVDVVEGRTECPEGDRFGFDEIVENLTGGAFWTCNLAIRREKFEEMRGFDEDFTQACAEDMEFAWRMRERGLRSVFATQATVTHPARRMGLRAILARTAAHRWVLLYRLKTGMGPGLDCSAAWAVAELTMRESLDSLRMIVRLWRKDRSRIKGRTLWAFWRCASLPSFLPYFIYWQLRYRRMLRRRRLGGAQ
jgi:GT2 family glycosyltransferase